MNRFNVTVNTDALSKLPDRIAWKQTIIESPITSNWNEFLENLRYLETDYSISARLESRNVYNTIWTTSVLQTVAKNGYPLKALLESGAEKLLTKESLACWETVYVLLYENMTEMLTNRLETAKSKKLRKATPVTMRSFHISDNDGSTLAVVGEIFRKIEIASGVQINWKWLASYNPTLKLEGIHENPKNWITTITGTETVNQANIRAWKNKIMMNMKGVDLVVGSSTDTVGSIAFALINLMADGSAIIPLYNTHRINVICMIHIFRKTFASTFVYQPIADDVLYLCGYDYLANLTSKQKENIYAFCDVDPAANQSIFSEEYISSADFTETLNFVNNANNTVYDWRISYYEKLLLVNGEIISQRDSDNAFAEEYARDNYKDRSDSWRAEFMYTGRGKINN